MNGPERKFFQRMVRNLPKWDFQRIETLTSLGVPDVHLCTEWGEEFWLELKAPKHVRETTGTVIRPEQFAWGNRRAAKGGKVYVLSEYKDSMFLWKFPLSGTPVKGGVKLETKDAIKINEFKFFNTTGFTNGNSRKPYSSNP